MVVGAGAPVVVVVVVVGAAVVAVTATVVAETSSVVVVAAAVVVGATAEVVAVTIDGLVVGGAGAGPAAFADWDGVADGGEAHAARSNRPAIARGACLEPRIR